MRADVLDILQFDSRDAEYSLGPSKLYLPGQLLTPGTSDHRRHTYMTVLTSLIELGNLFVWLWCKKIQKTSSRTGFTTYSTGCTV